MIRKLDDTHVGEYKVSLAMTYISAIIIVLGVIGLFLLPITQTVIEVTEVEFIMESLSPVNYLLNNSYNTLYGYSSIAYIVLFSVLFINMFLCLSIPKIGKGIYSKICKIIEFFLSVGCLILHSASVLTTDLSDPYVLIKYFFFWLPIIFLIIILSIISYFTTKKISIYD